MEKDKHIIIEIPEAQLDFSNENWKDIIKKDFQEIQNTLESRPNPASPAYYTWFWFFMKYGRALSSDQVQAYMQENNLNPFTLVKDAVGLNMSGGGAYTIGYKFFDECLKKNPGISVSGIKIQSRESNVNPLTHQRLIKTLYRPYITAIKSKPFLLLAGISGTGKSRIVRELARACWNEGTPEYEAQKPSNFEMIQVKPNWHDSTELMGYVSRVSGKPVYIIGDFLRFITRAWENLEVPHFLCLDEMNLAPVEQYFAEFLSVIESRKSNGNGTVITDPILKKSTEEWYRVLTAELTGENEALRNQFLEEGITIPQNLIVVGTVNMDETTFSFSRKVLDRAMTIEMNEVDLYAGLQNKYERIGKLTGEMLIGTAVEGVDVYSDNEEVCNKVLTYLQAVNDVLDRTPFKIAYRTRNEFLLYVVNNLPYTMDENGNEFSEDETIAIALDEITSMKILSRIEGDDTKVKSSLLKGLIDTIEEQLLALTGEEKKIESVSIAKLKEMQERLSSGYTSFWS